MTVKPLVSVIMPAYNCASYIGQALNSALAQDYENIEIIVINDGSTDSTPDILASYGDRITVLNQKNSGSAAARNFGLRTAKGEYLAFLDSDDYWLANKISLQVEYLQNHPDTGLVYCDWIEWRADQDGKFQMPSDINEDMSLEIDDKYSGWLYNLLLLDCYVHTSTVLMRKPVYLKAGEFDVKLRRGQDYDYWIRVSRITKLDKLKAVLSFYRIHGGSITRKPHGINYGIEVINKALNQWSNIGPDGTVTEMKVIRKRLALLWFGFGYEHYVNGDKQLAIKAFRSAIRQRAAWLSPWKYLLRSVFRKS